MDTSAQAAGGLTGGGGESDPRGVWCGHRLYDMSTYLSLARLVATESTLCLAGPFVHPDRPGSFVPATLPGALPLSSYVNISTIEPLCTPPPLQVTRVFLLPHDATCQEERSVRLAPPIRPTVGCATLLSRTLKEWCGLAARGAVCVSVCSAPPSLRLLTTAGGRSTGHWDRRCWRPLSGCEHSLACKQRLCRSWLDYRADTRI